MFREAGPSKPEIPNPNAYKDLCATFIGSFPLSPQQISGHYLVFELASSYYHLHQPEILGTAAQTPPAPHLDIPKWHISLSNPQSTAESIWETFINKLANQNPTPPQPTLESLFGFLARTDENFYENRVKRHAPVPEMSHLRRYFIHQELPAKNGFYSWLKALGSDHLQKHKDVLLSLRHNPNSATQSWQKDVANYINFWESHLQTDFFTS